MNKKNSFIFNGKVYYIGTIIKINEDYKKYFGFNSRLKFSGYIIQENACCFTSLYNALDVYKISNKDIMKYTEGIVEEVVMDTSVTTIDPKYIDGIVSAWIWYIIAMFFSLAFKNIFDTLLVWTVSTLIFFNWRNKKIRGE